MVQNWHSYPELLGLQELASSFGCRLIKHGQHGSVVIHVETKNHKSMIFKSILRVRLRAEHFPVYVASSAIAGDGLHQDLQESSPLLLSIRLSSSFALCLL